MYVEIEYDSNDLIYLERFIHDEHIDTFEFDNSIICKLIEISKNRIIESKDNKARNS